MKACDFRLLAKDIAVGEAAIPVRIKCQGRPIAALRETPSPRSAATAVAA